MSGRRGIVGEVLVSLAVVMVTATGLLASFFIQSHASQIERLRGLLGRALVAEARGPLIAQGIASHGLRWWWVLPNDEVVEKTEGAGTLDEAGRHLAAEARVSGHPLLRAGPPWEPVRFALRVSPGGDVLVARLPESVPRLAVVLLLLADAVVFVALGGYLLRRGVIAPLRRLAEAARSTGADGWPERVPVTGVGEVAEVAQAFNEMGEALERRTGALEKAVAELRETNESLRRARDGLVRSERQAAVGRLAAGVAHEVGNPMGALLAFLDLAAREPALSEKGRDLLRRASVEGERVRRTIRQLLDFSRPPRAVSEPVDVVAVARQAVDLVSAQRKYAGIAFVVEAEDDLPPLSSDPGVLVQVFLNLLLNAGDALRGRTAARVVVGVRRSIWSVRSGEEASSGRQRDEPDAVECEVADNGPGIPEEDRERIFDPFYTTKAPGEGTGLGLANALRLAEQLGGRLGLAEEPRSEGAAFVLRLPLRSPFAPTSRVRPRQTSR